MSTTETTDGHLTGGPKFCDQCGTPLAGGRFCPGCGQPVATLIEETHDSHHDELHEPALSNGAAGSDVPLDGTPYHEAPTEVHHAAGGQPSARSVPVRLVAGVVLVLALIAGGVAAFLLLGSDGESADTAYRQKVAAAFGPVLGANREVSDQLSRLRGTKRTDARLAVRRAQQATTMARGALGALSVPPDSELLARDVQQVLDRETAYLAAVSAVLAKPSRSGASELQTLSSNLTSAFSAAGPTVAGTSQTVDGADRLAAWAPRAARVLRRRAKASGAKNQGTPTTDTSDETDGSPPPSSNPYATGRDCGSGLHAGPNTSCEFAASVRSAYREAPGSTASVRAFSPATGRTYTMNCSPSGTGVTCSGGNDASVTF